MKNRNFKIGALLVSLFAASCSPALYQSGAYNIDDMYAEHDVTRIAQEKQAIAEARKAEAEARRAEIEARQAEAAYYASDDSYQGVLADTYESAYARRLRRERDSNPRYSCPYTAFRVRPDRPLRHLSFSVAGGGLAPFSRPKTVVLGLQI